MASLEDFNFHLPEERIAREPARPRDHSKLLLCSARGRLGEFSGPIAYSERRFHEVLNELNSNDVLVLNNAKVLPVRLLGHRLNDDGTMGGQVEAVLSTPISDLEWNAILHLSARVRPGLKLRFEPGLIAEVLSTHEERLQNAGEVRLRLSGPGLAEQSLEAWLVRHGHVPLPTYMERSDSQQDRTDYQTVYAERIGSAAAPTAGMHFTQPLLDALAEKGVHIERLTLHVGIGTFRPIKATRIEDHQMHEETYEITDALASRLQAHKSAGRRIVAVGTTVVRALESWNGEYSGVFKTRIFISPGYHFRWVDDLITNFHLPKSTLLVLIGAAMGVENMKKAYQYAIDRDYRFYSYGDAMFLRGNHES